MGAASSLPTHPANYTSNSTVIQKRAADDDTNGDVYRNAKFPQLVETAFPGEVTTLYDGFQCVPRPPARAGGARAGRRAAPRRARARALLVRRRAHVTPHPAPPRPAAGAA